MFKTSLFSTSAPLMVSNYTISIRFMLQYDAALTLLEEAASVNITEDMAEKLCPDKNDKCYDSRQRKDLLIRLAYICQAQQKYTLAYKKFQQAGDINQGFKALLKSGDVELIFKTAKVPIRSLASILLSF